MKKLMIIVALVSSQVLVGCNDRRVGVGVGVGIGIGGHRGGHHHGGGRGGHWGGHHGGGHRGGHHGGGHRHWGVDMEMTAARSEAQQFADRHHTSLAAARKIQKAFENIPDQGLSSFASIGLKKSDLRSIVKQDLPSTSSLKKMAVQLDMSQAQARDLVLSIQRDFKAQASNGNSAYWRTCMQSGSWQTPQNRSCQSASESGCSPRTGASMCY